MALKSDRSTLQTDISFFMNEAATRGGVVVQSTGGSGASMDNGAALVTYAANASGKIPVGLLLNDMVNIDLTRQHLNQHQDEVQKGGKVTLLKQGYVVTNKLEVNSKPTVGAPAYVASSGLLSTSDPEGYDGSTLDLSRKFDYSTKVGRFLSTEDADGYAKVYIDIA